MLVQIKILQLEGRICSHLHFCSPSCVAYYDFDSDLRSAIGDMTRTTGQRNWNFLRFLRCSSEIVSDWFQSSTRRVITSEKHVPFKASLILIKRSTERRLMTKDDNNNAWCYITIMKRMNGWLLWNAKTNLWISTRNIQIHSINYFFVPEVCTMMNNLRLFYY